MKQSLLAWLARYDAWSRRWGLAPEYGRCCTPRRDEARADRGEESEPCAEAYDRCTAERHGRR